MKIIKIFIFLILPLISFSCGKKLEFRDRENYVNTEISCPNNPKILASHALAKEIVASILEFKRKNPYQTAKYTVATLQDYRTFQIKGLLPDEALEKCYFREILRSQTNYADYFYYF